MQVQRVFVALLVLFLGHCGVDAIFCHECNSHDNSTCANEKVPTQYQIDCSIKKGGSKYNMCRKIVQEINMKIYELEPDYRIIRGCGWDESKYVGKCYERHTFKGYQEVCSCTENNCNGASGMESLPLLHVGVIAVCLLSIARTFIF